MANCSTPTLRQGDILLPNQAERVMAAAIDKRPTVNKETYFIVLSQNCDIVGLPDREPYIELITAHQIINKDHSPWRNPRSLHLDYAGLLLGINIHDRFRVNKAAMVACDPDKRHIANDDERVILRQWVASRYVRPAFPNAFNERLKPEKVNLEKLLKTPIGKEISRIYILGASEEVPENEKYVLDIMVTYPKFIPETASKFDQDLEGLFARCRNVVVADIKSSLERDVTLEDVRNYKWLHDYEFLSLAGKSGGERPSEQASIT